MITILLGGDTLSKQNYISEQMAAKKLEARKIRSGDALPNLDSLSATALFGAKEAFIFENCWKELDAEQLMAKHAESDAEIFIVEESIDQRKTVNKEIVKDRRITVKTFELPLGSSAEKWLSKHAGELGMKIEPNAIKSLAHALAPDEKAKLNVMQAHNELLKLKSYAGSESVTSSMVDEMVVPVTTIDTFALLDAVALKNKSQALLLLEKFFAQSGGDEKAKAIQFSALLADQLRNILLVLDAVDKRMPDETILEKTGWKSGRLFVIKKLSRSYSSAQIKLTLAKLESLDIELKSSTMPPLAVLDMILSQK